MAAGSKPPIPLRNPTARLETWKEIAVYLRRDIRTVQRWEEAEGLPVHRQQHRRQGSVFAIPAELDEWVKRRTIPAGQSEPAASGAARVPMSVLPTPRLPRRRLWWMAAATAGVLAVVSIVSINLRFGAAPRARTVAVLPFLDESAGHDLEYLADGLTEQIIDTLSTVPTLRVVARTSVFEYKRKARDVRVIGRQLGADFIMEGSIRRSGDTLRVSVDLNRASDGLRVWSQNWNVKQTDLFASEDEIAGSVARHLEPRDLVRPSLSRKVVDPNAFDAYLAGKYQFSQFAPGSMHRAELKFREAVALQPDFAPAWAALVETLFHQIDDTDSDPRAVMPAAKEAALRAVQLDDSSGEAHTALGIVRLHYDWDWQAAELEFHRAMQLLPGSGYVRHWYAHVLTVQGKIADAIGEMKQALALDPLSAILNEDLVALYHESGRLDLAISQMKHALELQPDDAEAQAVLAIMLQEVGDAPAARKAALSLMQEPPNDPAISAYLVLYDAQAGDAAGARTALQKLEQTPINRLDPLLMAAIYHVLRQDELAVNWLETAFREHRPELVFVGALPHMPVCSPQFASLLQRMHLRRSEFVEQLHDCR